jgi:hypothetical protein
MGTNTRLTGGFVIRNVERQTLGFERGDLPADEFRIALPELLSDADRPILPWGFVSPQFEIRDHVAQLRIELPGEVRMRAGVHFGHDRIKAQVSATNLSRREWRMFNAFTCFACHKAPSFHDPAATRTYFPVDGKWTSVSELPGRGSSGSPFTFLRANGGPDLDEFWVCRQLHGYCPEPASQNCACVISADGNWVAGVTTRSPAYLFNNQKLTCVHAAPLVRTVPPGATTEAESTIFVFRGTIGAFAEKCRVSNSETSPFVSWPHGHD